MNPSSVNLMSAEMTDFDHSNPSLSSDDTLATSAASPILEDTSNTVSNGSQEHLADSSHLIGGYASTDDCESEDGLTGHSLLGDVDN